MINHHVLKIFEIFLDFPIFFRTFLGSSETYPGVQNRSLGTTFPKFWKFPKWSGKCLGGSRRLPGVPRTPYKNINFSSFFLYFSTYIFLMAYCIAYCIAYWTPDQPLRRPLCYCLLPIGLPIGHIYLSRSGGLYFREIWRWTDSLRPPYVYRDN